MNLEILISFVVAVFALAISPGPDNIFVLVQSLRLGKKYGIATVLGLMTGCLIHTSLVAFGVSLLIVNNDILFMALKVFGACYLLYLAYKVFKSSSEIDLNSAEASPKTRFQLFQQGFVMNVLNPKVSLFFLALFPGFLFSESMSTTYQFIILGAVFILVSFMVFTGIAMLSGSLKTYMEGHKNAGRFLKWLQIIVFVGIAIFICI